jgi:Na+/H+-dicarboxylate symporter
MDTAISIRISVRVVAIVAAMALLLVIHVVLAYHASKGVPLRTKILRLGALSVAIALAWDVIGGIIGATMVACCMPGVNDPVSADRDFFFQTMALPYNLCSRFPTLRDLGDTFCTVARFLVMPLLLFVLGLGIVSGTYLAQRARTHCTPKAE